MECGIGKWQTCIIKSNILPRALKGLANIATFKKLVTSFSIVAKKFWKNLT